MTGSEDGYVELESKFEMLKLHDTAGKVGIPAISLNIWPPSERTRKAVVNRFIEIITVDTPMSNRSGMVQAEETAVIARKMEEESFVVAGGDKVVGGDANEVLLVYAKQISKRMMAVLLGRASSDLKGIEERTSSNTEAKDEPMVESESN